MGKPPSLLGAEGDGILDALVFGGGFDTISDVYVGGRRFIEGVQHAMEGPISADYRKSVQALLTEN